MEFEKIYFSTDFFLNKNDNFIFPKQNELQRYSNEIKRYTGSDIKSSKLIDLFETLLEIIEPLEEEITVLGMSVSLKVNVAIHFALASKYNFYYKIKLPVGTKCLFFYHYSCVPYEFEIYLGKKCKFNYLFS